MLARHDQHVPGIHRLHVQEGNHLGVLVAHGNFARATNDVAERTGGMGGVGHGSSSVSAALRRAQEMPVEDATRNGAADTGDPPMPPRYLFLLPPTPRTPERFPHSPTDP